MAFLTLVTAYLTRKEMLQDTLLMKCEKLHQLDTNDHRHLVEFIDAAKKQLRITTYLRCRKLINSMMSDKVSAYRRAVLSLTSEITEICSALEKDTPTTTNVETLMSACLACARRCESRIVTL